MQDRQLYAEILGIKGPWFVERVEARLEQGEVPLYLDHAEVQRWECSECGRPCPLYDHQPERQRCHLDTCQYRIMLHARPPRSDCSEHGVRAVKLAWAEASSRFTALLKRLAIDWLHAASQKAVGENLGLSWEAIHGMMERAVSRAERGAVAAAGSG